MASDAKREAARLVVYAIDDWSVRYLEGLNGTVSVEARAEMESIKDAFIRVAEAKDGPVPEGWSAGDPVVGTCSCDLCVAKRVAAAKANGTMVPP